MLNSDIINIRTMLALFEGYRDIYRGTSNGKVDPTGLELWGHGPNDSNKGGVIEHSKLPNYHTDLNAIQKIENKLNKSDYRDYSFQLFNLLGMNAIKATAETRAKLLATIL